MKLEQFPSQIPIQENKEKVSKASILKTLIASAMILLSNPSEGQGQLENSNIPIKDNIENFTGKVGDKIEEAVQFVEGIKFEDGYNRFYAKDSAGTLYINPWVIVSPLQVEISSTKKNEGKSLVQVPYKYSRGFNTAEAQSKEDQNEARKFLEEKLREEFVEKLVFWDFTNTTKDVYNYQHENGLAKHDINKTDIKSIKITGFTSPEGPDKKGKESIAPGSIDKENLSLGEKRGGDMDPVLREALANLGINEKVIAEVTSEEIQFSENELSVLAKASFEEGIEKGGNDSLQAAYLLIKKYNDGEKISPETKELLDKIVGSKRMVEIEITYEENKKEKHVVPVPLLLLALYPGLRWLKRIGGSRKVRERLNPTTTEDPTSLAEAKNNPHINWNDPAFIKYYNQANEWLNEGEGVLVKKDIADRILIDEFNPYLGTKKDDIDYFDIVKYVNNSLYIQSFNGQHLSNEEILRVATLEILNRWEDNDLSVRNKKGDTSPNSLHYWQDAQKIAWANMTAEEVLRLHEIFHQAHDNGNMAEAEKAVYGEIDRQVALLREQEREISEREKIRTARVSGKKVFIKPKNYRKKI